MEEFVQKISAWWDSIGAKQIFFLLGAGVVLLLILLDRVQKDAPVMLPQPLMQMGTEGAPDSVVYAYMLYDPTAPDFGKAWYSETKVGRVLWVEQSGALITTSLGKMTSKRSKMMSKRGKGSIIRKFFLIESKKAK